MQSEDVPVLRKLYEEHGFEYDFPDLEQDEFFAKLVLVDEDDVPRQAILMRITAEMFLLQDKNWETPGIRNEAFARIHEAARRVADAVGVKDVHAWLPPEIEKSFGRRLKTRFGWVQQLWPCFSREIQHG